MEERERFTFFRSFYEATEDLNDSDQLELFKCICKYAFEGKEPNSKSVVRAIFKIIKPIIDKSFEVSDKRAESGRKGGTSKNKQTKAKQSKIKQTQSEVEVEDEVEDEVEVEVEDDIMPGAADADTGPKEPAIVNLMLNDKSLYPVTQSQIDHWSELYPAVDVKQELLKMQGWLESNPSRRKTKRGINAFITGWLAREQDKGKPSQNYNHHSGQTRQETPETNNPFLKLILQGEYADD